MKPWPLWLLLLAYTAYAAEGDEEWLALVQPISTVEIGLGRIGHAPPAAGNLLGVGTTGSFFFGSIDLRGGDPAASASRWRVAGQRLGLDSPELSGEFGAQGRYRLRIDYDEIPRFLASENYHTPQLGAGETALTLPPGYPVANPVAGSAQITATQRPFAIGMQRKRTGIAGSLWLTPEWELRADFREDRQTGTRASGATMGTGGSSIAMILPEPVDTITRRFETSLAYQKERSHLQFAYRGSFFNNAVESWTFQNPFSIANTLFDNRMGSTPDNQAHQLSMSGGFPLGRTTRLSASLAYGRLTQNETFLPYSTAGNMPPHRRLDGLLVNKRLNLKLTSRPFRDLRLNTSYRFDSRDNRTPVGEYNLPGVSAARLGEVGAANVLLSTTPYSRRQSLSMIEAIYAIRSGSDLTLALQRETTARYCNGHPHCVEVGHARENGWRFEWRQDFTPLIIGRLGYSGADRQGDDYRKYAESVELAGMRKFFLADRRRDQWRGSLNASLTDSTSLGFNLDLNQDAYRRSPYGLQSADSRALNIDLSHSFDEDFSLSLFGGRESFRSKLASSYASSATATITDEKPGAQWQINMNDTVDTAGISLRHKGLFSGLLEFDADLVWVRTRSPYQLEGGPHSAGNAPAVLLPAPLPKVNSRSTELRLNARYALDEQSALRFLYLYRRLASTDFALDLYANENLTRLLGTQESAPRFDTHWLGVSYLYRFR